MPRLTRSALTLLASALISAVIAVPAVANAAPTPNHPASRAATAVQPSPQMRPGGNGMTPRPSVTKEQVARMAHQCQRVMQTPQMQKKHQQMMKGQMMAPQMMKGQMMAPPASPSS